MRKIYKRYSLKTDLDNHRQEILVTRAKKDIKVMTTSGEILVTTGNYIVINFNRESYGMTQQDLDFYYTKKEAK